MTWRSKVARQLATFLAQLPNAHELYRTQLLDDDSDENHDCEFEEDPFGHQQHGIHDVPDVPPVQAHQELGHAWIWIGKRGTASAASEAQGTG